jgi:Family of unknown function (DUF6348)
MGLFDLFKKKNPLSEPESGSKESTNDTTPIDINLYILEGIKSKLIELGFKTEKHPHYLSLIVNSEIEIATSLVQYPNLHPTIMYVMTLTMHKDYFEKGIEEFIVGMGLSIPEKVREIANNYVNTIFLPIVESFSDSHDANVDFKAISNNKEILWHPKLANLSHQGQWKNPIANDKLFKEVADVIKPLLSENKFNWLKLYVSRNINGQIEADCVLNNVPIETGMASLRDFAKTWTMDSEFKGLKQFIMLRRCDAYDHE